MQASTPAANFREAKKRLLFFRSGVEFSARFAGEF